MSLPKIEVCLTIFFLYFIANQNLEAQIQTINGDFNLSDANWIGDSKVHTGVDSMRYGDHPASLFRKEFTIAGKLKSATLSVTAAGYFLTSVNGIQLPNNVLDPAWTNFSKRIYGTSYDVKPFLHLGKNLLGTMLGNGFYNLLPLRMFGNFNLREVLPSGPPQFIARLHLTYQDGTEEVVLSDSSWKTASGPISRNNVYLGEIYDARKEIPGWNLPVFDDENWRYATKRDGPGGVILPAFFPAVQVTRTIKPVKIVGTNHGFVADMGVNLTGLYKIRMKGDFGDTIVFRFGERVYENGTLNPMTTVAGQIKRKGSGGPGSPDIAWQTDSYIFGKDKEIVFQPHFTFHVFRFIEITGLKYEIESENLEAIEFHTNVENINSFSTSSELLNKIQRACRQTFLNNLISVQSDCPAREKFGYGGDLNATSESFIANFDMHSFYRKTIYDWVDAMQDSIFIDTAPFVGIKYCGISWESAFLTTQYRLLQYYGDSAIVDELYRKDLEWMDKVKWLHPAEIIDKGLSDHESLEKVPVQLIGSTHYLECARIMSRFAELKHDTMNCNRFRLLEQSLTRKLLDLYWHRPVLAPTNRQTLFATLIYYGIIPPEELSSAADSLLSAIRSAPSHHFTTGIFGTKYILEALSMTGHSAEVFQIVNSTAFPGWGFMVEKGATTIWESWKESDNTYSNCHPMFGTVSEWYYRWLAGIRPLADYPGFKRFTLAPEFPQGLNHVEAAYQTPFGAIMVSWKKDKSDDIELMVTVPAGTTALFKPGCKAHHCWQVTNVNTKKSFSFNSDSVACELKEGEYRIN